MKHTKSSIVFFDLDGTLVNSLPALFFVIKKTLGEFGISTSQNEIRSLVGANLTSVYKNYFHLSPADTTKALKIHQRLFLKNIALHKLYPGIKELLHSLVINNICIGIITSKSKKAAKEIIDFLNMSSFISILIGKTSKDIDDSKINLLKRALEKFPEESKQKVAMVGDRKYDLDAAETVGILSIGVTYGFGTKEEISKSNPDYTASSVKSLHDILLG